MYFSFVMKCFCCCVFVADITVSESTRILLSDLTPVAQPVQHEPAALPEQERSSAIINITCTHTLTVALIHTISENWNFKQSMHYCLHSLMCTETSTAKVFQALFINKSTPVTQCAWQKYYYSMHTSSWRIS